MVELKNDALRRVNYTQASEDVRKNGFYNPVKTMDERLVEMRMEQFMPKKRKRLPWFTVLTVATTLPFFMFDGKPASQPQPTVKIEHSLKDAIDHLDPNDQLQVEVGIGARRTTLKSDDIFEIENKLH